MKSVFYIFLASLISLFAHAQKPPLDYSIQDTWPEIGNQQISNDGKYVLYTITSRSKGTNLLIKAIDNPWERSILSGSGAVFTEDSRCVIFKRSRDSMGIIRLGEDSLEWFSNVASFKIPERGKGEWLAYQLKDESKEVILYNLLSGKVKKYSGVDNFIFSANGETIVLIQETISDSIKKRSVIWNDLSDGKTMTIWNGYNASNMAFDITGRQFSFIEEGQNNQFDKYRLWYYQSGMDSAVLLVGRVTPGMAGMSISKENIFFSKDGYNLFFFIQNDSAGHKVALHGVTSDLIIWGYQDDMLNDTYLINNRSYTAVINLHSKKSIIRLEDKDDYFDTNLKEYDANYILIKSNFNGDANEYKWRLRARPDICLLSIQDGSRKIIRKRIINDFSSRLSLNRKYVIWYDLENRQWYTYNVSLATIKCITKKIPFPLYLDQEYPDFPKAEGIAGWLAGDAAVLIYDRYDIWKVDPDGIKPPVNITKGYGRKNQIRLRYIDFHASRSLAIGLEDTLLLSAFDVHTKNNGFLKVSLKPNDSLIRFPMHKGTYYFPYRYSPDLVSSTVPFFPLKAKYSDTYLFKSMSPTAYPNLCATNDFSEFKPLSNLEPQKEYNWYSTELMHWRTFNNKVIEGIIYKPENFDPQKKYPVIFYYYELMADALNAFIDPRLNGACLNIPWYVSHGYIVFVPDIHHIIGYPGESAYNSIVSAALMLSKTPWVDAKKMALQGHSYGGYETNYIITRTSIFAAAAPAAATSDIISELGQIWSGSGKHEFYEIRQGGIGATLWQRPDLYIKNSPIFKADKVSTPLLLLHNMGDNVVYTNQSIEWFTALRRLGKKAWLLQYIGEYHNITNEKNQLDYAVRLNQFFDHYLKGVHAPSWMMNDVSY